VLPDKFIPLVEEYGLIDDLTMVVLANALEQSKRWQSVGAKLCMSINISMESLTSLEFPDKIQNIAHEARVPLSNLVLEVTESRLMNDRQLALDILTR
ncbi:EAL domain-containing protein, partial [Vibrio sp. 10N.261.45.F1]